MEKLVLHEYAQSGNCYKVRLTAALLGLPAIESSPEGFLSPDPAEASRI